MKPIAIDLFSGCGGLTLGLKRAGFRVIGAVEADALAVETYKSNHNRIIVWQRDIRRLPASQVMLRLGLCQGQLDLLAGCPPCQGFSTMTTLNGRFARRDPRNNLVDEFLRFVRVLRPKALMLENVPGLVRKRGFRKILAALRHLGYNCAYDILDAAEYGVPQRRRRMILVGGLGGMVSFGKRARSRMTLRDAIADLARTTKRRRDRLHREMEHRSPRVAQMIRMIPKDGGSRRDLPTRFKLKCHQECNGFKDVYGRMGWDDVAPTITSGCVNPSKGRFLHPSRNRTITLREAAILQAFPRRYRFALTKGKFAVAEMIGNALPPEFIRRHALGVYRFLKQNTSRFAPKALGALRA